ncbi:MAG: ferrous iron transporter B [Clostridia bacterium]|nr:ferrous iron transporter B [Clostridia bacterium]
MTSCHDLNEDFSSIRKKQNKILLMGNPNVGKSVFFSYLTGINVLSSNFAGTTVSYMEGKIDINGKTYILVDVPGIYSMEAVSDAEAVATRMLEGGADAVICVLDATNLERNIKLALEISQYQIPMVYALNMMDVAERHGTQINVPLLEQELGAPVIPTIAVKGEGFAELKNALGTVLQGGREAGLSCHCPGCKDGSCQCSRLSGGDPWERAGEITRKVRKTSQGKQSFLDLLGEQMIKPFPGIFISLAIMVLALGVIVGGGKALRAALLLPLVSQVIVPFFRGIFASFIPEGVLLNVLIGEYGIFVISFEWIIALILPYVFLFYVVFSFLEDSGYLPRASVMFDNIMRKIGLQGGSLITITMGFGCAVPAIIGSRAATTKKERLMVSAAVCFAVPCISQTGALISLLGSHSMWLLAAMFLLAISILVMVSLVTNKILKGQLEPLIIEVPNLLLPSRKAYFKKLWIRMRHFLMEAEVPMLIAIVIAAVLKETGLLDFLAVFLEPLISGWLGMPKEAVIALVLGIVRREMAAAPLLALDLNPLQIFVGATVALLYLPCLSVFGILTKEFGVKTAVTIALSTTATAFLIGGIINKMGLLFI